MIKEILLDSFNISRTELEIKEQEKLGILRGGSTGCFVNDNYYGECPRVAQMRYRGKQTQISEESDLVFNMGFSHEARTLSCLLKNPQVKEVITPEGPHSFKVSHEKLIVGNRIQSDINGYKWSGAPDFIVTLITGEKFGIETKALASPSSAAKIQEWNFPYTKAILQAAIYSHVTGLPWYILYGMYFYPGYTKGTRFTPYLKEFGILLRDNKIVVRREDGDEVDSEFTVSGIMEYYKHVASSEQALPRPCEKEHGPTYNRCEYCSHKDECVEYDMGMRTDEQLLEKKGGR